MLLIQKHMDEYLTSQISLLYLQSLDEALSLLFFARAAFLPGGGSFSWVSFEQEREFSFQEFLVKRNLEIEMAKPDGDLLSWLSVRGILEQKQRKLESVSVSLSNWCLEHAKILIYQLVIFIDPCIALCNKTGYSSKLPLSTLLKSMLQWKDEASKLMTNTVFPAHENTNNKKPWIMGSLLGS